MFLVSITCCCCDPEGLSIVTTVTSALSCGWQSGKRLWKSALRWASRIRLSFDQTRQEHWSRTKSTILIPRVYTNSFACNYKGIGCCWCLVLLWKNGVGVFTRQSTDDVLEIFGIPDHRQVRFILFKRLFELISTQGVSSIIRTIFESWEELHSHFGHPWGCCSFSHEVYYIKGSIEIILDRCKFHYVNGDSTPGLDGRLKCDIDFEPIQQLVVDSAFSPWLMGPVRRARVVQTLKRSPPHQEMDAIPDFNRSVFASADDDE